MTKIFRICVFCLAVTGLALSPLLEAAPAASSDQDQKAPKLYRYISPKGAVVTSYVLPPDMVTKGYQIVTLKGDIIQTVKPALTDEERQAIGNEEAQKKFDKALSLKYGTLAELVNTQKRKTEEVEAKMSILRGNLMAIGNQKKAAQQKAANYERQGKPVPPEDLAALDTIYKNEEAAKEAIQILQKEFQAEKQRLEYELVRFKAIKGIQ